MAAKVKDYLGVEAIRNKKHADLYRDLLKRAYPGETIDVLVGHHICFEFDKDIETENEIPAADTLLFDHDILGAIFGARLASRLMHIMVDLPPEEREPVLRAALADLDANVFVPAPPYDGPTASDW